MSIFLTLLFLSAISLSHAQQLCGTCPDTTTCVTDADKCGCFQRALNCYNLGTGVLCSASAKGTCSSAPLLQCTLTGCPAVDPCASCATTYAQCVATAATSGISAVCSCVGSYTNCLSTNCGVSASITSNALCNAYSGTCPSLGCAAPTGFAKCSSDYTTCLTGPSASPCTCLNTYKTCIAGSDLPAINNQFDSSCLVYSCSSVACTATVNNTCGQCVSSYASCALNAIKTGGLTSTCGCLNTMLDCLGTSSSSCGTTAYNSLCPMLSPYCPDMKCGASLKLATPKVDQIVNLIDQYKTSISQYLGTHFSGSTFTFGATTTRANAKVVALSLVTDPATLTTLLENLRTKLAEYFGIAKAKITIEAAVNTKRDVSAPLQYNVVLDNSNSSGASAVVLSVFALVAALALLM